MNKKIISVLIAFTFFIVMTADANTSTEANIPLNHIVAIVNDEIITQSELDIAIAQLQRDLAARNLPVPPEKTLHDEALTGVINFRLQLQIAARAGIKTSDKEVDEAIGRIAQANHLTLEQLKEQLTLQKINYVEFRNQLKDQIIVNKLQQQMANGRIKISDEEVAEFKQKYEKALANTNAQYHFIDFFLPLSENATAAESNRTLKEAQDIQQKLIHQEDINKIVPPFRDLGWREKDNIPQIFVEQLSKLNQNISLPFRAPNGYHVLKLIEVRNDKTKLPSDEQIRQLIARQKVEDVVKTELDKLRHQSFIQIMPEEDKQK